MLDDQITSTKEKSHTFGGTLARLEVMLARYRSYVPLVLTLVMIFVALWGYRGSQVNKLGPPFGSAFGTDFYALLRAAGNIAAGDNPYTPALAFGQAPNFIEFISWDTSPYIYPPLAALLFQPFLYLSPEEGLKVWNGGNFALLVGSALLAVRAFTQVVIAEATSRFFFILTLFLVYYPSQADLKLGQVDILILFLLLLTYLLYRAGFDIAALPLALAITIKPILGPMLLFFLWKGHWRLTALAVITMVLLTLVGFWVIGWHRLADYLESSRLWANGPFLAFPINQSPRGFMLRLFTDNNYIQPVFNVPWLSVALPAVIGLLAIVGWGVSVARCDNRAKTRNGIEYGLTLTTLMLLSPLTENIHFVWALIPLSALLIAAIDNLPRPENLLLLIFCSVLALYLGYPALLDKISTGWEAVAHRQELVESTRVWNTGLYLYGLILLNICLATFLKLWRADNSFMSIPAVGALKNEHGA